MAGILDLHREDFPIARRPVAPEPGMIDRKAIRKRHVAEAKKQTSVFSRAARKAALQEAERRAEAEALTSERRLAEQRADLQSGFDRLWEALNANDPATVLAVLAAAFEDNEAAAAAVGVEDAEVSLLVIVPATDAIPERRPATTPAGNLTLKKMTKAEKADFYKHLVAGHLLVTVKEAFAVAPGLSRAKIAAVRLSQPDAYGARRPEVMAAAMLEKSRLEDVRWADADAIRILNDASSELLLVQKGASKDLQPLDVGAEPELAALVDAMDFEDVVRGDGD